MSEPTPHGTPWTEPQLLEDEEYQQAVRPAWHEAFGQNICPNCEKAAVREKVDRVIIETLTACIDRFVGECIDDKGEPKAPSRKALMRARAALPERFTHSLIRKKSEPNEQHRQALLRDL